MSLEKYVMNMPRTVYSGVNSLENLKTVVSGATKVAVFTDRGLLASGLVDLPIAKIKEAGKEVVVFSDLPAEPTYMQAQKLVDEFRVSGADFIVAVGGIKDLLDDPLLAVKTVPTCLVPTTAGTGSEATQNAIVGVPEKELKIGIVNPSMIPDYVILDAEMIRNLPRSIGAATGIDAMAHAIECFTSNKANPFSDTFALEAFDLIINNIERACDDPTAMDAKNKMQIAAFYGGAAIACSGTTAVHALSYPLGGKYHIAHGVSNAILLVPVMEFNEPAIRDRLAIAYDRVVHGEKTCTTVEEKSAWVVRRMGEIVKHLDIPTSLKEFNVSPDDLESLVEAGMQVTRLLVNNMREVTAEDARNIYRQIL